MKNIENYNKNIFESIKHIDENNNEYWYARELMKVLEYTKWQNFNKVIKLSIITCKANNLNVLDHFTDVSKMIKIGKGGQRKQIDFKLSREACYIITLNSDPRKEVISYAKMYFASKTRSFELFEDGYNNLSEDEKRLLRRKQTKNGNLSLNYTALKSGVKDFDKFHNAGYKGLYGGESADDIAKRKGLRYKEDILDNMNSEELGANIFRITQTEAKLKRDKVDNEYIASSVHYEIGKKVRKAIKDMGGTMPEDLPTPKKSIQEIEKENDKYDIIK